MLTSPSLVLVFLFGCLLVALLLTRLLPFILGPVGMWRKSSQAADPDYVAESDAVLPAAARRLVDDLRDLGFADLGTWRHVGGQRVTGRIALLEQPQTFDAAKVLVVWSRGTESVSLVLQTRFADGAEVVTANNRVTAGLPTLPGITVAWLPDVRDAEALYAVHEQLRDALAADRPRVGVGDDPGEFLRDGSRRVHAHWVATGYYWLDEDRGMLWPTWKGAVLVTSRLLWPIKPLFRAWRRRGTERLLRALDIDVEV